ncbi:major facilitator superfamily domain-containing protein [Xylogone sp. PMI_703]|nr:major facilitator superfamily domain-containing protein [Xylogone sp. PMI_703]
MTDKTLVELRNLPDPGQSPHDALYDNVAPEPRNNSPSRSIASLPPTDRGKDAWLFLTGCFFVETLLWGFPFSFGILQEYYINHDPFRDHSKGVSAIGTTCSGIMYLAAPVLFLILHQYPQVRRKSCVGGLITVSAALILSSFCHTVSTLILTQGILYGIGGCFLYYPIYFFIDEWFITRKGLAFGIMWAGSGIGGLSGPLIMGRLLATYGFEVMIRAWAVALLLISGPLLYFVKPRLPIPVGSNGGGRWKSGWQFITTRSFWILQLGNTVQGLGYFIPSLYLPEYISSLNYSPLVSSALLSALNSASVPGVIFLSSLCDKTHVTNVILISTLGSAISVLLFWGLSTSIPLIAVFAVSYGFFAGGFTSTYAGTVKSLMETAPRSEPGSIIGMLSLGRGIGNVVCGPLSELLLNKGTVGADMHASTSGFAYQSSYGTLIVFTGVTAAVGMCGWVAKVLRVF